MHRRCHRCPVTRQWLLGRDCTYVMSIRDSRLTSGS